MSSNLAPAQGAGGSTFEITLKEVEVVAIDGVPDFEEKRLNFEAIVFEAKVILIVDDIDFNRELLKGYLEDYDFILQEAENGLEALEKVKASRPDLILMDMKMPIMTGYEASMHLKKDENLKGIPIIAITASAMKSEEEKLSSLCDAFVKKPISRKDLIFSIWTSPSKKWKPLHKI